MSHHPPMDQIPGAQESQAGQFPAFIAPSGQGLSAAAVAASRAGAFYAPAGLVPGMRLVGPTSSVTDMMLGGPAFFPMQTEALQVAQHPLGYRDFSRVSDESEDSSSSVVAAPSKDHSFPTKLHKILADPEYSNFITWLPHGRSWRVLKPKAFEEKVIPKFFRHAKYASFMRQVNGWGFKRMTQGPDHNSYYHELFLRGLPKLCEKMRRPSKTSQSSVVGSAHPDFYQMSIMAPLANNCNSGADSGRLGATSSSEAYPASSDSDGGGSSDRYHSRDDSGGGSSDGDGPRDGSHGSNSDDRNSACNGSDPSGSACGSEDDRNSGSEGFVPSSSERGRKTFDSEQSLSSSSSSDQGQKSSRRFRRQEQTGGDSSDRLSMRDLNCFSNSLPSAPSLIGSLPQEVPSAHQMPLFVGQCNGGLGFNAAGAFASIPIGQAMMQPPAGIFLPMAALNQLSPTGGTIIPLTATSLGYLSLQNQLVQSQALIAQMQAYQQQLGIPPMTSTLIAGAQLPGVQTPNDQGTRD